MREKVDWASSHGTTPPRHAVQMAAEESPAAELDEDTDSGSHEACCKKSESIEPAASCCSTKRNSAAPGNEHKKQLPASSESSEPGKSSDLRHEVNWVAGFFAQKCRGSGFNDLGILNIGIPPALPTSSICEDVLVERHDIPDQIPNGTSLKPIIPPPKSRFGLGILAMTTAIS
jgi:hypothetical protein